jgi:subtilase family serine protease
MVTTAWVGPAAQGLADRDPDLATLSVHDPRPHASPGEEITVRAKIRNVGRAPARRSVVRFYLGHHRFTAPDDVPFLSVHTARLPARTSRVVKRTAVVPDVPTGGYFLVVCTDARKQIAEHSEGNNCRASTRQVTIR